MIKRMVVKIGTSLLTRKGGHLDVRRMARLVREMAEIQRSGREVVIVTSGAISAGVGELGWARRPSELTKKQAAAAVGQPRLMETYRQLYRRHGIRVAQVLVTREDFENKQRRRNAQHTLLTLLAQKVVPIINENDTVAVEEIRMGDNDTLAARVAIKVRADLLVLLTDVDGLMTPPPGRRLRRHVRSGLGGGVAQPPYHKWHLIRSVEHITPHIHTIAQGSPGSDGGTGGMETKVRAAQLANRHGVNLVIASGKRAGVLKRLVEGRSVGTFFARKCT